MKPSKIIYTSLIGLAVMATACSDDFLDREPISQSLQDQAITSKSIEDLIQGAYSPFYGEYYVFDFMTNGDAIADNCYAGGDNPANIQLDSFNPSTTNANVTRDWRYLYDGVKSANEVLNGLERINDPSADQTRLGQIKGEALFLRSYHYFNLVRIWGGVPLMLKKTTSVNDIQPRSSVEEVYKQITADLTAAAALVKTDVSNKSVVTQGAVWALLAKVYASQPVPDWNKVNEYCQKVSTLGYILEPAYADLFKPATINSKESILEIQNDASTHWNWLHWVVMGDGWKKFNTPTNDLVKAFDEQNDNVRKGVSIKFNDYTTQGWSDNYWNKNNYPEVAKFPDDKSTIYILRYADILLLWAEAKNQLNDLDGAKGLVNTVRARVSLSGISPVDKSSMTLAIEKERRIELAFEGHRWFDLLRTNRALEVMKNQKDGSGNSLNYSIDQNKLVLPIPQEERDRNPKVTQNPGY